MLLGVMVTLQVLVLSLRVRISQEHQIHRCSSVGRVLGLGPRCRRFEPCHLYKRTKKCILTQNDEQEETSFM